MPSCSPFWSLGVHRELSIHRNYLVEEFRRKLRLISASEHCQTSSLTILVFIIPQIHHTPSHALTHNHYGTSRRLTQIRHAHHHPRLDLCHLSFSCRSPPSRTQVQP